MPFPKLTHALCFVEVNAIHQRIADNVAGIIRNANPDPEANVSWITEELVATALQVELITWRTTGQQLDDFPTQHSPQWTNAFFD